MRRLLILPFLALAAWAIPQAASPAKPAAKKLFFVFLTKSDGKLPEDKDAVAAMSQAHLGNFSKQFAAKNLIAAGPLQDPTKQRRGIVVLTVDDEKAIPGLFTEDPFIQTNVMKIDAGLWSADRKGIHDDKIDPEGLEENRIVVATAAEPLMAQEQTDFAGHVSEIARKGVGGWVGKPGERGVYLFQGKEETSLKAAFEGAPQAKNGRVKIEVFPLFMGKGTLAPRS